MRKLTSAIVRDIIDRHDKGKLSFSKAVDKLNEWVFETQDPEYIATIKGGEYECFDFGGEIYARLNKDQIEELRDI